MLVGKLKKSSSNKVKDIFTENNLSFRIEKDPEFL